MAFSNLKVEELASEDVAKLTEVINKEPTEINTYFNIHLQAINISIEELTSNKTKLIQTSAITPLLEAVFLAKKIIAIAEGRNTSIKITPSELEGILINCKSVINGTEKIAELTKKKLLEMEATGILVYLAI